MASLRYETDQHGKEILLSSTGQQVMMEWEKDYMETLVEALCIDATCDVLEIGFGCGYSANCIQSFQPKSHTIIECDSQVLLQLDKWAADKPSVKIIRGLWQVKLPELSIFDCIFFDDYPLPEIYPLARERRSRWYDFLDEIVYYHVRINSRITGYLAQKLDLSYSGCTLTITEMSVTVPENCTYFEKGIAFIPLLTVQKALIPIVTDGRTAIERSIQFRLERVREQQNKQTEALLIDDIETDEQPLVVERENRNEFIARLRHRAAAKRKEEFSELKN